MKLGTAILLALSLAAMADVRQSPGPPTETIQQLVARVNAAREMRGFTLRARLETTPVRPGAEAVLQIRILGRRNGTSSRVLYQVLWPATAKGRAVYVQFERDKPPAGFFFELPDRVTPLAERDITADVFGTALNVDDLTDDFWQWAGPVDAGTGMVARQPCRLLEFRPPLTAGSRPPLELVTACVSTDKAVPLAIEKYGAGRGLSTRLTVEKTVKLEGGLWAPSRFLVEHLGRGCTTRVEITRGERDKVVSLDEFSLRKIKSLGRNE
jgi:hypothetical protein